MTSRKLNPDSTMLQQSDGQWMKYCGLILMKLSPDKPVVITMADITAAMNGGEKFVLIHGHTDSVEFKMVTREEAERLAAYDATLGGTA